MKPTLYLMMGFPGAGKTTIAQIIAEQTGAVHLSSDATRTEQFSKPTFSQAEHDEIYRILDTKTEELLQQGLSVIYDANLNRREHRQEKYNICSKVEAIPSLIWVRTKKEVAKARAIHGSRSHLVPRNESAEVMFERIASIIEEPDASEPSVQIIGEDVTTELLKTKLNI